MPWVNGQILQLINKKHRLFRALKNGLVSYLKLKYYAQILKMLLDRFRMLYFKRKYQSVKNDSGKLWKTIIDVIGKTKNNTYIKEIESSDHETLTDKKLIANVFNQYFNTLPTKTQSNLDPSLHSYDNLVPVNEHSVMTSIIENVITQLSNKIVQLSYHRIFKICKM